MLGSWVGFGAIALAETNAPGGPYTPQRLSSEADSQFARSGFRARTFRGMGSNVLIHWLRRTEFSLRMICNWRMLGRARFLVLD